MPEFTDACSEICSTPEPRNGFSFSKIHHQVMAFFFLVSKSCGCEHRGCAGGAPTPLFSLSLLPKIPRAAQKRREQDLGVGLGSAQLRIIQGGFSPRGNGIPKLHLQFPALRSSLRELTVASLTLNLCRSLSKTFLWRNPRISGWQSWDGFVGGVHFPGRVSGRAFVPQGLLSPCQEIKGGFVNSSVKSGINTGKTKRKQKQPGKAVFVCCRGNKYLRD